MNSYQWRPEENGLFSLYLDGRIVLSASAQACCGYAAAGTGQAADGSGANQQIPVNGSRMRYVIDTRRAKLVLCEEKEEELRLVYEDGSGLVLTEVLSGGRLAKAQCILSAKDGRSIRTDSLTPLIAHAKGDETPYLWRDLAGKLLLVPYDNDMWMRYEAAAPRAGRRSSDVTVLFSEETREGILIGASDFSTWKNAIACPGMDARILEARCGAGACGEDTHDFNPHGIVEGTAVASSPFIVLYGPDYRDLLETYADALAAERKPRSWDGGVPFGFNSYAGLAMTLGAENFRESGRFLYEELQKRGFESGGATYINLDGGWQRIPADEMLAIKDEMNKKGQKAGIYDAPFACFWPDLTREIPLMPGHTFEEIVLRNEKGEVLPRVDRSVPYDVTHPVWKEWTRKKARQFAEWGYDYLKIDFLSHAGMEGVHYDSSVTTGRQALEAGYRLLEEEFSEEKLGRPFFLSLSIAPLFPYGYGTARRFSCDAFGLTEDVEYVLNAQTYSWWTGGRLYRFNDADHIVLQRSFCMLEDSTEGEARARYTAAVIAGSMLLLSEDYSREGAKERTIKIAGNPQVNEIARKGIVFRPVESAGTGACCAYTAKIDGTDYAALFHLKGNTVDLERAGLPEGSYTDLWTGSTYQTEQGFLRIPFSGGTDAVLLRRDLKK